MWQDSHSYGAVFGRYATELLLGTVVIAGLRDLQKVDSFEDVQRFPFNVN